MSLKRLIIRNLYAMCEHIVNEFDRQSKADSIVFLQILTEKY
jgi:hypothetical protein